MKLLLLCLALVLPARVFSAVADDIARTFLQNAVFDNVLTLTNSTTNALIFVRGTNNTSSYGLRLGQNAFGTNEFRIDLAPMTIAAGQVAFVIHSVTVSGTTNIVVLTNSASVSVESNVTNANASASTVVGNITSIALTPGLWLIGGNGALSRNGATYSNYDPRLSVTFTTAGLGEPGVNASRFVTAFGTTTDLISLSIAPRVYNLPTNATIYLTMYPGTYSIGTPKVSGNISAIPIR